MASQLGYSLFNEVQEQTNSNKRKNKTIKKKPPKPSSKVKNFLNAMAETQNVDEDNDGLADFQPPAPPEITKQPEDIKENFQMEDIGITPEAFQSLDNFAPQREHYNNYVPYFTNNQASVQKKDKLLEKLNYMIHLLEENKDQKTENITEELVLYMFLGVFVIFVVDSFARAGKYTR